MEKSWTATGIPCWNYKRIFLFGDEEKEVTPHARKGQSGYLNRIAYSAMKRKR